MGEQQPTEQVDIKPFIDNPWFGLATGGGHIPSDAVAASHNDDSSSSYSEDNSAYFQFFRGIYGDYQELSGRKQRLFRRQCLHLLHRLLDEEQSGREAAADDQSDAINLSSSSLYADDVKEQKVFTKDEILPN